MPWYAWVMMVWLVIGAIAGAVRAKTGIEGAVIVVLNGLFAWGLVTLAVN